MDVRELVPYAQIVGALSVPIAVYALYQARKLQHTIKAQDFWSVFIQRAMDHPVYAFPPGHQAMFDYANRKINLVKDEATSKERHSQLQREAFERYEWFLSYLLKSSRQILDWLGNDRYWKETIERNINYHAAYLSSRRAKREQDVAEAKRLGKRLDPDYRAPRRMAPPDVVCLTGLVCEVHADLA